MGAIYHENPHLLIRQPQAPLAGGALELSYKTEVTEASEAAFEALQNLAHYWKNSTSFFCLERRTARDVTRQVIPYPQDGVWGYLRQIQVIWNAIMPRFITWASSQLLGTKIDLEEALQATHGQVPAAVQRGSDAFCSNAQLAKQQIFEGKRVRVLYNFKPLSPVDLLIVPKDHCETVADLDKDSYVETMQISDAIAKHSLQKHSIVYINHANGKSSGQTVPHWNVHVSVAGSRWEEILGALKVIGKILGLVKALPDNELAKRIKETRNDLEPVLAQWGQPSSWAGG